jgi:hypothetical protein
MHPRYYVPWSVIIGVASISPAILVLYIRYYLDKENKRRDALLDSEAEIRGTGLVESTDEDGQQIDHIVDNSQLDLTDRENLTSRHVL